jgi:hypothetical protein
VLCPSLVLVLCVIILPADTGIPELTSIREIRQKMPSDTTGRIKRVFRRMETIK